MTSDRVDRGFPVDRVDGARLAERSPSREGPGTLSGFPVDRVDGARLAERSPSREGPGTLSGFPYSRWTALLFLAIAAAGACKGQAAAHGSDGAVDGPPDGIYLPPAAGRIDTSLDGAWRFLAADAAGAPTPGFDDSAAPWSDVTLPHTWNALDGENGGSDYYRGVGWYRRHLTAPADFVPGKGRQAFLQFDGANIVTDVYLNGTHLGQHRGGFAAFRYDVTAVLTAGDNVLAVKVDNSPVNDVPPLSADFTFFGGLYRDAHLLTTDALHVDVEDFASSGVYITPANVSAASADLSARVRIKNAGAADVRAEVLLVLVDARGVLVQQLLAGATVGAGMTSEVMLTGPLSAPHLWNGRGDPYLYTAYVQVGREETVARAPTDVVSQPVGFRSFAVDPSSGFSLNGQPYDLHGVNRHQDRLDMGWAITDREHDQDMALIVEMGATAVRLAHYQHAQHFYDLADRNGIVVWAEIPLVNAITASQAFTDNAHQQMNELIRQSFNHPAIVFWSIGNEQRNDDAPTNTLLGDLAAQVASLDPSRLSTYAHCCTSDTGGLPSHTDVVGYNEYFGWYGGTYNQFGGWADGVHAARPEHADRGQRVRRGRGAHAARRQPGDASRRRAVPPRGVPGAAARGDLEADRGAAFPVGQVHLEHVRLRGRQPQRGRHAGPQRQGHGELRSAQRRRTRSSGTRPTGRASRSSTSPGGGSTRARPRRSTSRSTPTSTASRSPSGASRSRRRRRPTTSSSFRRCRWRPATTRSMRRREAARSPRPIA